MPWMYEGMCHHRVLFQDSKKKLNLKLQAIFVKSTFLVIAVDSLLKHLEPISLIIFLNLKFPMFWRKKMIQVFYEECCSTLTI